MDYIQKTSLTSIVGADDDDDEEERTVKQSAEDVLTEDRPVYGKFRMEDREYIEGTAFQIDGEEVVVQKPEEFKNVEDAVQRLEEVQQVNDHMKAVGSPRRYVVAEGDAPPNVHVHEDAFGKFYFETLEDVEIRPSHVAEYKSAEGWVALDKESQILSTLELMSELTVEPILESNTKEAAENWLERHLVLTDDDPAERDDIFTHEFKSELAELISSVTVKQQNTPEEPVDKTWEGPFDGPQGGTYWENTETGDRHYGEEPPAGAESVVDDGEDGDPSEVGDEILDDIDEETIRHDVEGLMETEGLSEAEAVSYIVENETVDVDPEIRQEVNNYLMDNLMGIAGDDGGDPVGQAVDEAIEQWGDAWEQTGDWLSEEGIFDDLYGSDIAEGLDDAELMDVASRIYDQF